MKIYLLSLTMLFVFYSDVWSATFIDNGDGSVTDITTRLNWQQQDDDSKRNWSTAVAYCQGLTLGGKNDWRLPGVKELQSIVDFRTTAPAIASDFFPNTDSDNYWSATTASANNTQRWTIYFGDGTVGGLSNTASLLVRCVRGG